jgi:ABC-2 type transport system permease protein
VNIYAQELRMARAAMIAWTLGLVLITLLFVSIYPVFSHDIDTTRNLLAGFPPQLRSMLGLSLETMDSFLGFYAYTFTYVGLIGAVQAMSLGLTMLSREQRSKTVEFLLTRPVSRSRIFASKLMASLTVLTITNLVLSSTTVLFAFMVGAGGNFSYNVFALLGLTFFVVQLVFFAIGVILSQLIRRIRPLVSMSLGSVFAFFALNLLQGLTADKILRYTTPFRYFDHLEIVSTKSIDMKYMWLSAVLIIVFLVVSYGIYLKKDIRSAA